MATPRMTAEPRPHGQSSAALAKRIASGDESAFASLYDMTSGLIYGLLLRILGSSKTAEQVLVAVYQEMWEQAPIFGDQCEESLTWLVTTARQHAIARLRADSQDQERQPYPLKIAERTPITNSKTDEMLSDEERIVRSAFAMLPPVEQQIIELAYFSGLRPNEIAARLSLSLQSVQTGMRAAMMKLCDAFESRQPYSA